MQGFFLGFGFAPIQSSQSLEIRSTHLRPPGGLEGLENVVFLILQRLYPFLKSSIVGWIQVFSIGGLMKGGHLCRGVWGHPEIPI